jgi:hypothetical protein
VTPASGPNGNTPSTAPTNLDDTQRHAVPGALGFLRMAMLQAFWICLVYAAFGIAFDVLRRVTQREFWNRATQFVDAPALMALKYSDALPKLVTAAAHGTASPFVLRLVISGCTFLGIFIQAFVLSGMFYAALQLASRRSRVSPKVRSE